MGSSIEDLRDWEAVIEVFQSALILSTFLCSIVAGFLFAFAIVVMPGIKSLDDGEYIRTFQVMDQVIQNNQPVFLFVWVGSILSLMITVFLGIGRLEIFDLTLLIFSILIYLFGVQLPTVVVNIPLNNKIQTRNVDSMDTAEHKSAREEFESRWTRWNLIRTILSSCTAALLIILIGRT